MEIIAFLIIIYALKKGVDDARSHFGKSKAASRSASAGKSGPKRTAAALHHDGGYWASQILHGFPQARHGFATGWHAGRQAQEQIRSERERAKADHLETRTRLIPLIQEHRKRQQAALEEIRKAQAPELESVHAKVDEEVQPTRRVDGKPETETDRRFFDLRERGYRGPIDQDGNIPGPYVGYLGRDGRWYGGEPDPAYGLPGATSTPASGSGREEGSADEGEGGPDGTSPATGKASDPADTTGGNTAMTDRKVTLEQGSNGRKGWLAPADGFGGGSGAGSTRGSNAMPAIQGDTTYTQQLDELTKIRADAEEEVNSVRRKRMMNRLDILTGLSLDSASLSEAAAIDDALQEQEKAAKQTFDAADSAVNGLKRRHGGIQEAVDSSPVAQPAQPEFYAN